jgi:hypothetical protein
MKMLESVKAWIDHLPLYPWYMHEELTLEIHTERLCIRQDENNSELRLIYLSQTESKMQPDQSCEGFRIWIIC